MRLILSKKGAIVGLAMLTCAWFMLHSKPVSIDESSGHWGTPTPPVVIRRESSGSKVEPAVSAVPEWGKFAEEGRKGKGKGKNFEYSGRGNLGDAEEAETAEEWFQKLPQSRDDNAQVLIQNFAEVTSLFQKLQRGRISRSRLKKELDPEMLQRKAADGKTVLHTLMAYPGLAVPSATQFYNIDEWHYKNKVNKKLEKEQGQRTNGRHKLIKRETRALHSAVKVILSLAPDLVEEEDINGDTPLHFAAYNGDDETIAILLDHKADPNARNKHGQTPLHKSALYGSLEASQRLLQGGADRRLLDAHDSSFDHYIAGAGNAFSVGDALKLGVKRRKAREDPRPADGSAADCSVDGGYNVGKEDPSRECSIDRRTDLTAKEYLAEYGLQGRPVIMQGILPLAERCHLSKDVLMKKKSLSETGCCGTDHTTEMDITEEFRCGPTAYPRMTYQEYCPRKCSLERFNQIGGITCEDPSRTSTAPKYRPTIGHAFDLTPHCDANFALQVSPRFCRRGPSAGDRASPFPAVSSTFITAKKGQFFVNGKGGGATMHFHTAAYNALFFGYKNWYLAGPKHAAITGMTVDKFLESNKAAGRSGVPLSQCVQRPGDVIFVPNFYGHATRCDVGLCTGMGNLYNDVHGEQLFLHGAGDHKQPYWATNEWVKALVEKAAEAPEEEEEEEETQETEERRGKTCPTVAFVHINKAGGSSMLETLEECCTNKLIKTIHAKDSPHDNFWFHAIAHRQRRAVGPKAWKEAYKFALVRNPWSRQLSMFIFLLSNGKRSCDRQGDSPNKFCRQLSTRLLPDGYEQWGRDDERVATEYRQWLHRLYLAYPPGSKREYLFGSLPHGNEVTAHFKASQLSWLVDEKGDLLVDEVVKLEDLNREWPRISTKLCLKKEQSVSKINSNKHRHYSFYYDEESRDILHKYMAPDIERFGYAFEQQAAQGHELAAAR